MFLLKKFISPLLLPVPFCSMLLIFGLITLWFTRRQKAGQLLVSTGALLLILLGYGVSTRWLWMPLERQYSPILTANSVTSQEAQPIKWIVVLVGGGEDQFGAGVGQVDRAAAVLVGGQGDPAPQHGPGAGGVAQRQGFGHADDGGLGEARCTLRNLGVGVGPASG